MYRKFIKRIVDIVVALFVGLLASPFLLLGAIATKIENPKAPVFFSQRRCGQYRMPFKIYKIRTMRIDAPKYLATNDFADSSAYITRVGRLLRKMSIDEIPQLLNILLGDMSFVGPRPVVYDEEVLINLRDKLGALTCKPGITGYAQIRGRDDLPTMEKAKLDAHYARHISAWLDIKIMFLTVPYVLLQRGVKEAEEDMSKKSPKTDSNKTTPTNNGSNQTPKVPESEPADNQKFDEKR